MRKHTLVAPFVLAATLAASQAFAAQATTPLLPAISSGGLEAAPDIAPVRGEVITSYAQIPKVRKAAWDTFLTDAGSTRWQALWDTSTGVPLRIFGGGIAAPGSTASASIAESHARDFIARHRDLIAPGIALENLKLSANDLTKGMRTVAFVQSARVRGSDTAIDVPVIRGQLSFRYKNDRLFVIASEVTPNAKAEAAIIDAQSAKIAATSWMSWEFASVAVTGEPELVVLPLLRERGAQIMTTWRVSIEAGSMPLKYDVYIDAGSGRPIAREMLGRFLQGTALYDVGVRYPKGERKLYAPRLVKVGVDGVTGTTDPAGLFSWDGSATASVELSAQGEETTVHNHAGADVLGTFSVSDGGMASWSLADDQFGDAQLAAFIHASLIKERVRLIAPEMTFLAQKLTVNVNRDDPMYKCNAYWDGTSVNFFIESNPCNNTARLADVVYHEFGHGVHQNAIIAGAGMPDPSLGEGQADYLACTTTGDPDMAPGFFINGGVLRHCDNDRRWPEDVDADPHETGLIFTGAMWDLRASLIKDLGAEKGVAHADALYYGAIQRSTSVPTTYAEVLATDDDDGDLTNGTPNICAINQAFVNHGLSPYLSAGGLTLKHDAIARVPFGADAYPVKVSQELLFPQCGAGPIDSIKLLWGPHDTVNKVTLTKEGSDFVGEIPAQADGSALRYRIVTTVEGNQHTLPDNPADPEYRVFVGDVTPLYCNDFESGADDWTFGSETGGAGDFKVGTPKGLSDDPSEAFSGDIVIGNDLSANGSYAPEKVSFADSPVVDLAGNQRVRLQFRRWLAVEDGYFDHALITVNGKTVWENEGTDESFGVLHHIDKEWRFEDIDLSWVPLGGKNTAQVRFSLEGDKYFETGGWTIDDFCIVAVKEPPVVDPGGAGGAGGAGDGAGAGNGAVVIDQGCGCRTAGSSDQSAWAFAPFAALAAGLAARRARARATRLRRDIP